jgi:gamma-glutamylputrescine oxidase
MGFSYWEQRSFLANIDLLVIGSGIVGLSTAIYAKRSNPKMRVAVAERDVFSSGASTKNAGFACFGSPGEILDDLTNSSEEVVFQTVERRILGLQNLRNLLGDNLIQFESSGGYEIFTEENREEFNRCREKLEYLNSKVSPFMKGNRVYSLVNMQEKNWGFQGVIGAISNDLEGLIHTGEMMRNLMELARKENVQIFNGLLIDSIESTLSGVRCRISDDFFDVSKVVVCTNGMARQLIPSLDVNPARNQVIVTSEIEDLSFQGAFHLHQGYVYFRHIGKRVLIGGFRHLDISGEATWEFGQTEQIQSRLEACLKDQILPGKQFSIDFRWSGIMGLGETKKPIVKEIAQNICVAVRMGGMGVAIGTLIGKEAAEWVSNSAKRM